MKKTLLLSVVASTMIMAGGDIAPVEPVVEAPAAVSGWDFAGQAVVYYQTGDNNDYAGPDLTPLDDEGLFDRNNAVANAGIQLTASNKDVIGGIGATVELSGLATLGLEEDVVGAVMQTGDGDLTSGAITQAFLTYGMGNTTLKFGRQNLPKALSPFAFSEGWSLFKNSFDAMVAVNTDLPNTTLVGAYVARSNAINGSLSDFNHIASAGQTAAEGVYMLTAQNTSIEGVTLTGTWYLAPDMLLGTEDVNVFWADAKFAVGAANVALQGGKVSLDNAAVNDTTVYGAKVSGNVAGIDAAIAYSSVDNGTVAAHNLGTNVKTPLYTQLILNQNFIKQDADTVVVKASMDALGGKVGIAYNHSDIGAGNAQAGVSAGTYTEFDLTYKTKVGENTSVFAGYVYQDLDADVAANSTDNNFVRVWARYNF